MLGLALPELLARQLARQLQLNKRPKYGSLSKQLGSFSTVWKSAYRGGALRNIDNAKQTKVFGGGTNNLEQSHLLRHYGRM